MKLFRYVVAAALLSLLAACGSDDHEVEASQPKTILATAQGTPSLSSLVAAAQFASDNNDLVNLLS